MVCAGSEVAGGWAAGAGAAGAASGSPAASPGPAQNRRPAPPGDRQNRIPHHREALLFHRQPSSSSCEPMPPAAVTFSYSISPKISGRPMKNFCTACGPELPRQGDARVVVADQPDRRLDVVVDRPATSQDGRPIRSNMPWSICSCTSRPVLQTPTRPAVTCRRCRWCCRTGTG